jgi:alanine dehydrogenase
MRLVDAATVHRLLDDAALVAALRDMFRDGCTLPTRHHHSVAVPGGAAATLLLMPAWREGAALGVKLVTVFPDNGAKGLPAVQGQYLLLDGSTGVPRALIDGPALTVRRTAAASALAATYLARQDAARMVMVGTGAMAPHLVRAHCAVRPVREVSIWGRAPDKARALAAALAPSLPGVRVSAVAALEPAVRAADIVSCATLSRTPLVAGAWLKPGAHLDLVGGFTPEMRETDDEAVRRARVYVDTRAGALKEAGDIVRPIAAGVLAETDVRGDLFELCRGTAKGRQEAAEITLFKSVGTALEDLAAAMLVEARSRA